jgi:hypothetical protein
MAIQIKHFLKTFVLTKGMYSWLKLVLPYPTKKFAVPSFFHNASRNKDKCCLILAGYKDFLWDIVFERVKQFSPDAIDICIVSSGIFSIQLLEISKKNNWSYISTKRNCVTQALNTAIQCFPFAQYIYKLDEDIFITNKFFEKLLECYNHCITESEYTPAFVAPLIPVNPYGYLRILKKLDLVDIYKKLFTKPKYNFSDIFKPHITKFFWGDGDIVMHIDEMNKLFSKQEFCYSICPIRFSIGAILFERSTWENMGYFNVYKSNCMGIDEDQLCALSINHYQVMIVSENTVVGHLSFGRPFGETNVNDIMKEYFFEHTEKFAILEKK